MSRPRLLSSAAVLLATVAGASWYASTLFPIVKAAKADAQVSMPSVSADRVSAENGSRLVVDGNVVLRVDGVTLRAQRAEVLLDQLISHSLAVHPITPENPIPRRTRGVAPVRPSRFADAHVVISPRVTVDRNGTVMSVAHDACEVAGAPTSTREDVCDAFFEPTAVAIRQWRYERPAQGPIQFYVHVRYQPGAEPTITQSGESSKAYVRDLHESQRRQLETDRDAETFQHAVASLQVELARLSEMSREFERAQRLGERGLLAQSTLQDGMARLREALARVEEQLQNNRLTGDDRARAAQQYRTVLEQYRVAEQQYRSATAQTDGQLLERRALEEQYRQVARQFEANQADLETLAGAVREAQRKLEASNAQRSASVEGPQQLRSPSGRTPLQVTAAMTRPVVIKRINPEHSAEAMRARAEGTVTLEVLVDERGLVADARVVKSIPLLDESALAAAKQWEFRPALLNGEPVPVLVQLEMNFTLK